ncbi:hypothetical protein L6258_03915, partial [Candidatus Parcubacteria bacterium]|nr:hypothetical protein [Candidatus Parcubacteria bacterium]
MPKKLVLILLIVLSLVPLPLALAEDTSDYQESLAENQRKQQEYLQEITRLRSEEVNLQNQISYFNSQIYLTTLQI